MNPSSSNALDRLERRWDALVDAPFTGTMGPMAAYYRFIVQQMEFADAVRILQARAPQMESILNDAMTQKKDWAGLNPSTDEYEASFGLALLKRFSTPGAAEQFSGSLGQFALNKLGGIETLAVKRGKIELRRATPEGVRLAIQHFVGPTHRFLIEHVEREALVLRHFDRFATWTRWFGHGVAQKVIDDEALSATKRKQWEERLKSLASEWVFRDGLPVSRVSREPDAATGNVDYLLHQPDRVIVVEAKLMGTFGPSTYSASGLASAVNQLRSYLNDHAGSEGFLLVFHNHAGEVAVVESATLRKIPGAGNSFEVVLDGTRRVGLILARLKPPSLPSKGVPSVPLVYTDLVP